MITLTRKNDGKTFAVAAHAVLAVYEPFDKPQPDYTVVQIQQIGPLDIQENVQQVRDAVDAELGVSGTN